MKDQRLELLRESLPYIQKFKDKVFVIKFSGKVTEHAEAMHSLAEEIALFHQVGFRIVVIHGGGKQLSAMADKLGIPQTIVEGRRVTDEGTLELAKMVFSGQIRTDILSYLRKLGVRAVGVSGVDGNIIQAKKRDAQHVLNRETGEKELVDFGYVGEILDIDVGLLNLLLSNGYVPVFSSLGADDEGNVYNINADTIASEIAVHLRAEKLILLSNVDGIYREQEDPGSKISRLSLEEAKALVESEQISAGMIPKLVSIIQLLQRGVKHAHILNGQRHNVLLQEIFTDQGSGTMLGS